MSKLKDLIVKNRTAAIALSFTLLYMLANIVLLYFNKPIGLAIPFALLLLLFYALRLEEAFLGIALVTPWAINCNVVGDMDLSLPSEPMLILFTALFLFRALASKSYDTRILTHPISILIMLQLAWWAITACTSRIPIASFKYLTARLWFVIPLFFAGAQIFQNEKRAKQFLMCYVISLCGVIAYATTKTLGDFSDLQTLHRVMQPFYSDHTAYGCAIALCIPATLCVILQSNTKGWRRLIWIALLGALLVGLMFSYCRAAWLSIVGAAMVYVVIRLKIKFKWLLAAGALMLGFILINQDELLYRMGKNNQDSDIELMGQLQSMGNISTDASNLERFNRWACAFRIFAENPVLGSGPGTYQFIYGAYQLSTQLSTISTNNGDLGNAHSEYIGPLTEQGIPGLIFVIAIFGTTIATGIRIFRTAADKRLGYMALAFMLSLVTYYIHGVFNNFLDRDKLSVPFWAFTAIIVALDLKNRAQLEHTEATKPAEAEDHGTAAK